MSIAAKVTELFVDGLGAAYDQLSKPAQQGAAEIASLLNTGSAYVPQGVGQQEAQVEQSNVLEGLFANQPQGVEVSGIEPPAPTPVMQPELEMGGRE